MKLLVALAVVALVACGASSSPGSQSASSDVAPDLVPATADDAAVTVTISGTDRVVAPAVVARVVPFLVRRVFEPTEPLASYQLDAPQAQVVFAPRDGQRITLLIGGQDFDKTAYYVQRAGDGRVWLVLRESIDPLLQPG